MAANEEGTDWAAFPVETISAATFLKRNIIHFELLYEAIRRAQGTLLEVGVGSGAQSALLSRLVPRVVSVDNDLRILTAARANLVRFGPRTVSVAGDAFGLPFRDRSFGVAISQGLMEHFGDEQIGRLLREMLRVSRSVVFSVPSDRYPRQDVGNERLLSPRRWFDIVASELDPTAFSIRARYVRFDLEALKYSLVSRRWLGSYAVLVSVCAGHPSRAR
jgi:SAM-dependent methyltransferase